MLPCLQQEVAAALGSDVEMEMDGEDRVQSHSHASTRPPPAEVEEDKKPPQPKKKKAKLSTGVHLLDPAQFAGSDGAPLPKSARASVAPSAELQPYHELIQSFMASQGFTEPTPIQEQVWPPCCLGKDVQGVAEPGSGKTLGYLLSGFVRLKVRLGTRMGV